MKEETTEKREDETGGATVYNPSPMEIEKARRIIGLMSDEDDIIFADVKRELKQGIASTISIWRKEGERPFVVSIRDFLENRCETRKHAECDLEEAARLFAEYANMKTAKIIESVEKRVNNYLNAVGYMGVC